MTDLMKAGIIIDGSHVSASFFNLRVIVMAQSMGRKLRDDDLAWLEAYVKGDQSFRPHPTSDIADEHTMLNGISEIADESVDWMNGDIAGKGQWFEIDENCLFLREDEDD